MKIISQTVRLIVVSLVIVLVMVVLSSCSQKSGSAGTTATPASMPSSAGLAEYNNVAAISPRISLVICPFTNSNNEITADALQFYFPTVFKANWTPTRIYNAPFDSYVYLSANYWELFTPGKQFSQEMARAFAKIFGSKNYVTVKVDKQESGYRAVISMFRDNNSPIQKELVVATNEAPLLPGEIAISILEFAVPDKVNENIRKYVQRPAANNPETLRKTMDQLLIYYAGHMNFSNAEIKQSIDADDNLDWLIPIYINMVSSRNSEKAVTLADSFAIQKSDNPRYQILDAAMLYNNGEYAKAIDVIRGVIDADPDNVKARTILAQAVEELNKPIAAEPYYQALVKLDPDSAWTNLFVGIHKKDLAWQHRGSGWASTVTREGWRNFEIELNAANKYLHRSIELDPYQIEAYANLITVGMGLSLDKGEVREYFKRAQAIDPNNINAYNRYQTFLMPKWAGSMEELREFWAENETMKLQNPEIYLLPVDAHMEFGWRYAYDEENKKHDLKKLGEYFSDPKVWEDIHHAYERCFSIDNNNPRPHAIYAYLARFSNQYDISFEQFEIAKLDFKGSDWVSYPDYLRAYCYVAGETKHFDRQEEIAQEGLKLNHCEGCNHAFQQYLDYARGHK